MYYRKPIPGWRRCVAGAALLILVSNVVTTLHPEWFEAPTGRIPLFGGTLAVLLFAAGLWYRLRVAYLLTVAGLAMWAWVAVERYRHGSWGIPAAYLFLAVAMLTALVLLVAPRSVRNEFFSRTD
jgi:hypothetical protein